MVVVVVGHDHGGQAVEGDSGAKRALLQKGQRIGITAIDQDSFAPVVQDDRINVVGNAVAKAGYFQNDKIGNFPAVFQ